MVSFTWKSVRGIRSASKTRENTESTVRLGESIREHSRVMGKLWRKT